MGQGQASPVMLDQNQTCQHEVRTTQGVETVKTQTHRCKRIHVHTCTHTYNIFPSVSTQDLESVSTGTDLGS